MLEENLSPYQKWKKNIGQTRPWDIINPNEKKISDDLKEKRLSICRECIEYVKLTTQCKKCGCIMEIKTRLEAAECPIGKWGKAN
jgi:hypothetical protein